MILDSAHYSALSEKIIKRLVPMLVYDPALFLTEVSVTETHLSEQTGCGLVDAGPKSFSAAGLNPAEEKNNIQKALLRRPLPSPPPSPWQLKSTLTSPNGRNARVHNAAPVF